MKLKAIVLGAGLLCAAFGFAVARADDDALPGGTWSINNWTFGDDVHLRLGYRNAHSRWDWTSNQAVADLTGLTAAQLRSMSTAVKFTLERDAGVFFCEGKMTLGVGGGTFRFAPSPSYASKLTALGYGGVEGEDSSLMFLAVRDLSIAFAAEVKRLGLNDLTLKDLIGLLDHGVDLSFLRELVAAGYPGLTGEDVIRLRDHGISASYVKGLVDTGRGGMTVDEIVRLHDHGIDPPYIARIQAAGFNDLTVDQIVQLHDHGVD